MASALDILGVTRETVSLMRGLVQKSQTGGFTYSTGNQGVDLAPFVSLVPVDTPFYNSTPRKQVAQGSTQVIWQVLQNLNALQSYGFVAADASGPLVQNSVVTLSNTYSRTAQAQSVYLDNIGVSEGYVDPYALAVVQAINQKLIQEDILMLNALSFSIGDVATPAVTASATGGTIPASTAVSVQVAARSGYNYFVGGSTKASTAASVTTGSTGGTNSVTAALSTTPELAAAYDWFVNGYYYTTTSVPTVTITSVPTANQEVPNTTSLPLLFGAGTVAITSVPTTDTSYDATGWTGLAGSILGDISSTSGTATYVTPGTAVSQGAYKQNLAGGQLSVTGTQIEQLDELLLSIYATWQLQPTRFLVAPQQMNDIASSIMGGANAVNFFDPTSVEQHRGLVAGGTVPVYVTPVVGSPVELQVQPHLPPGTLIAVCDQVPFPASNIGSSVEMRTEYDNFLFQYGVERTAGGPRWDFEVRSQEAFVNYAGPTMGVITGIAPGIA